MSIISGLLLTVLFFSTIQAFKVKKTITSSDVFKRDHKGRFLPLEAIEEEFVSYTSLRREIGLEG